VNVHEAWVSTETCDLLGPRGCSEEMCAEAAMSEFLTVYGTIYLGLSVISAAAFLVLAADRRPWIGPIDGLADHTGIHPEISRLMQVGYSEDEITRLQAYRRAVRAGYFTDQLRGSAVARRS
jgi:hypothetical protein